MGMNKNTVLAWATIIMVIVGLGLIALGAFRYDELERSRRDARGFRSNVLIAVRVLLDIRRNGLEEEL